MARALPLALAAFVLVAPPAHAEDLRIGRVTVRIDDVFSPEEAARGWVYRAANALHFKTHEDVLRRFLLFREGDVHDPHLLEESERNLRALPFVKSAAVTADPHDGVVDVSVVTQDTWTLEPGISYGSKGGVITYGFEVQERNLFGTGRGLSFKFDKGTQRTTRSLVLFDPAFLAPYVTGQLTLATSDDGSEKRLEVERPFFSFRERWSAGGFLDDLKQQEKVYAGGDVSGEWHERHREARVSWGRALLATDERARRLVAGLDLADETFSHLESRPGDLLPDDRRYRDVFVTYSDVTNDFVKTAWVNRDLRVEDFNLGTALSATLAFSPAVLGAPNASARLALSIAHGRRLGVNGFLLGTLAFETRLDGGLRNALLGGELRLVQRLPTRLLQTFVARLRLDRGWDLWRDVQLFADGQTGLRAYRLYAFEGNERVILNLEHRIFSGREVLQVVSPGAAVFVDTGTAVPDGRSLSLRDFHTDAGVGLRLGIARASSNNILRIDLAYAFDADPSGRKGWLVSFSSAQAF